MLKLAVFLACIYACTSGPLPATEEVVPILHEESEIEPDGKFHYSFESGDGIKVSEHGEFKVVDKDTVIENVGGSYEYTAPDGQKVAIQYIADENGYQPTGDVIPVGPPVPEAIARALKYVEEHPTPAPVAK